MSATSGGINVAGLLLVSIPLATIVGNCLVILSVLRYRALQSAINYLILGLAVADLFVALFVMPFAVYVHVYRGLWQLGNLMCDFYTAADVACSTASILLLAVISFDRYRAVSRPIQYSRSSQNVKRVICVICAIWFISLALASPIVFGVNVRPPDANPNECRFYNAEFSIGSSFISFVIPCVLVLFVYIRIIVALKKREKAAKLRRLKNIQLTGESTTRDEEDEAGRIVAGPVMNVMMMALPSMSKHMRRFERHRQAIEAAGEDADEPEPPAAALLRRVLGPGLLPASRSLSELAKERDLGGSSSPRSSIDESLSENIHVISNDFVSEGYNSQSSCRRSSIGDTSESSHRRRKGAKKFGNLSKNYSMKWKQDGQNGDTPRSASFSNNPREQREKMLPSLLRSISRRSPRLFRSMSPAKSGEPMVLRNPANDVTRNSQTESETISASRNDMGTAIVSRSTTANSEILGSPEPTLSDSQPTVTFALTVQNMAASTSSPEPPSRLKESSSSSSKEDPALAVKLFSRGSVSHSNPVVDVILRTSEGSDNERRDSEKSIPSPRKITKSSSSGASGLAGKLVKRTLRHEQSLKRKVSKAQRKEKRATKTLGVVVGVFLICWVPFFTINIVNAVCILFQKEFCQVGFDLFFYCTWIGYMNSFMNPIIYTIFNTEFRRAFKALLCGRTDGRAHLLNKQVHL